MDPREEVEEAIEARGWESAFSQTEEQQRQRPAWEGLLCLGNSKVSASISASAERGRGRGVRGEAQWAWLGAVCTVRILGFSVESTPKPSEGADRGDMCQL